MPKDILSKIAFVDVETTGTSATSDRIIDIGIVRVEDGKIVEEFETLINPQAHVSPYISQMTSITPEMLYQAPVFEEVKSKVYGLLEGATFVAHNAQFDYAFIKNEFARYETKFNSKILCTVRLSRMLFPTERHHNLDAVIERFGIDINGHRHRAFPDAKALYFFLERARYLVSEDIFSEAIKNISKKSRLPSSISAEVVKNIPNFPGVYIFYDKDGTVLYVGKSTHLKDRIMNHFSSFHTNSTDLRLASTIADIEIIRTGGDLSASLLEARLIKKLQPIYNRQLREMREVAALIKKTDGKYHKLELARLRMPFTVGFENILAVYPSARKAKEDLFEIIKEKHICPRMSGLEKGSGACFNFQIGKCDGACVGKETALKHNVKIIEAFGTGFIPKWPYEGKIQVIEEEGGLAEATVIDNWAHVGSVRTNSDSGKIPFEYESGVYVDTVKILKRFLKKKYYLQKIQAVKP